MRQEEVIHVLRCIGHPATTMGNVYRDLQRTLKWGEIAKVSTDERRGPHNSVLWSVVE